MPVRMPTLPVGNAPIAFDGFRICRRGIEAARDGWRLTADDERKHLKVRGPVGQRGEEVVHDPPPSL
jgi:hypothetical protein